MVINASLVVDERPFTGPSIVATMVARVKTFLGSNSYKSLVLGLTSAQAECHLS